MNIAILVLALFALGAGYMLAVLRRTLKLTGTTRIIEVAQGRREVTVRDVKLNGKPSIIRRTKTDEYALVEGDDMSYATDAGKRRAFLVDSDSGSPFKVKGEPGQVVEWLDARYVAKALGDLRVDQVVKSGQGGWIRYIPMLLATAVLTLVSVIGGVIYLVGKIQELSAAA